MQLSAPGESLTITALTGGVSSDIAMVRTASRALCVKRALAKLKVQADWRAPVDRNHWEVAWMRTCAAIDPAMVPEVLGEDSAHGIFAMSYLAPADYPLWKKRLSEGDCEASFAATVGARLGAIHRATARRHDVARRFATDAIFVPIRIEPYLLATASAHPDCADSLRALAQATVNTRLALVHGDVSPKNILQGPQGPVFLDAECAWYGDPAFDVAFCLNHLLLKCAWHPNWTTDYLDSYQSLIVGYLAHVDWERAGTLESRVARLLPGLMLARVDGKSPVEYLTQPWQKALVRRCARDFLHSPTHQLLAIADRWRTLLADRI